MGRPDQDLLELGGYWVYDIMNNGLKENPIIVNGTKYKVVDIHKDGANGLDAITVISETTGEVFIIYEGTNGLDDVMVDGALLTEEIPQQFIEADKYYLEMQDKLAEINRERIANGEKEINLNIKYLGGNSLGGSLANYVATMYQDKLFSVTLDPAPLPYGIKPGYNSMNYVANTSFLHLASKAAGFFPKRFPGRFEYVKNGMFSIAMLLENHVGYAGGMKGNGIDDLLPFSIWGNRLLPSKQIATTKIAINEENMTALVTALTTRMSFMKEGIKSQLDPVYETILAEKRKLTQRTTALNQALLSMLAPSFIINTETSIHLQNMYTILKNIVLPSQVKALGIGSKPDVGNFNTDVINGPKEELMNRIERQYVSTLLKDEASGLEDAFVEKIEKHHEIIEKNLHVTLARWEYVEQGAKLILEQISSFDKVTAARISSGKIEGGDISVPTIEIPTKSLEESTVFQEVKSAVLAKEEQLKLNFSAFKAFIIPLIEGLFDIAVNELGKMETIIGYQRRYYLSALYTVDEHKIGLATNSLDPGVQAEQVEMTSGSDEIQVYINEADRLLSMVETLKSQVNTQKTNIPALIEEFRPYINQAIFFETTFGDIQGRIATSSYVLENASLLFHEIWQNISLNESEGIKSLESGAKKTEEALDKLREQLEILILD